MYRRMMEEGPEVVENIEEKKEEATGLGYGFFGESFFIIFIILIIFFIFGFGGSHY